MSRETRGSRLLPSHLPDPSIVIVAHGCLEQLVSCLASLAGVAGELPSELVLVNNAGIQRYIDLTGGYGELESGEDEIAVNLVATVELTAPFTCHLIKKSSAAVINAGPGLGFMPMLNTPIYSATKAAPRAESESRLLRRFR
jgi:short-subunit dehydrogenase involved in D-alanine esterification of teichoic acids